MSRAARPKPEGLRLALPARGWFVLYHAGGYAWALRHLKTAKDAREFAEKCKRRRGCKCKPLVYKAKDFIALISANRDLQRITGLEVVG